MYLTANIAESRGVKVLSWEIDGSTSAVTQRLFQFTLSVWGAHGICVSKTSRNLEHNIILVTERRQIVNDYILIQRRHCAQSQSTMPSLNLALTFLLYL